MPKAMERKLKKIAAEKGYGEERTNAFVYGTMRNKGWKPSREKHTARSQAEALRRRV